MDHSAWDAFKAAHQELQNAKVVNAENEAKWLLQAVTGWQGDAIMFDGSLRLTAKQKTTYQAYIIRRLSHEPLAHITGEMEFWSLPFAVTPSTLIPRGDSETLVETVLRRMDKDKARTLLDMGTGTGCLLLSILHERPDLTGVGVDLDPKAVAVAAKNAAALRLASRVQCVESNWFSNVPVPAHGFDIIVSNPPYIPSADIAGLMPDVKDFEPHSALDGGADGLDAYHVIIDHAPQFLISKGLLAFEVGVGQASDVAAMMEAAGAYDIKKTKDLAGCERVVSGFFA